MMYTSGIHPSRARVRILMWSCVLILSLKTVAMADTWYVDTANISGTEDGTSWATAYTGLEDALAAAVDGDEIWVATGTYKPDGPAGPRTATFALVPGVSVYGGFVSGASSVNDRDPVANPTILSGDLQGNDQPNFTNVSDNCYHVLSLTTGAAATLLEGFTIQGGYANGINTGEDTGAGAYVVDGSLTLRDCILTANKSTTSGGGLWANNSTISLDGCSLTGNQSGGGGAIFASQGTCTITDSEIDHNSAGLGGGLYLANGAIADVSTTAFDSNAASGTDGGAIYNGFNGDLTVDRCRFTSNSASNNGGAVASDTAVGEFTNCLFWNSSATNGAATSNISSTITVTNCSFSENDASSTGGAMYNDACTPTVTNTILWGDSPAEIAPANGGGTTVTFSAVQGGHAGTGNTSSDPLFADAANGDLSLATNSPCIDTGTSTGAPSVDLNGGARPFDVPGIGGSGSNSYDMGCYEELPVVCVDKDNASGTENGQTWATAYTTIQPAIDAAFALGGGEVWVAEGTYGELRTSVDADGSGLNTGSVVMKENVHLYGGFAGTETVRMQREWKFRPTTIDGATSRSGVAAYHVVVGSNSATLDGFTIRGGRTVGTNQLSGSGAGMFNNSTSPLVANCTFTDNIAVRPGGGMVNSNCSPTVINCLFEANRATSGSIEGGGGMYNGGSSPIVTDCVFRLNYAGDTGGGMQNYSSSPIVTGCSFIENTARDGSGIDIRGGGSPIVTDCIFLNNEGSVDGGGVSARESSPRFVNCSFIGNSCDSVGGGLFVNNAAAVAVNCTFWGNTAAAGGGVGVVGNAVANFMNCTVSNNSATSNGDGFFASDSSPIITNCIIWGNGTDWYLESVSAPVVTYSNIGTGFAGGGTGNISADPLFANQALGLLQIGSGSPCIDTGTTSGAPSDDIVGNPRPVDIPGTGIEGAGAIDMGAYEMPVVVLVDKDNTGTENGRTWATAYNTIQEGITAASALGGADVWVAEGTYTSATSPVVSMAVNVHLYGGFIGLGAGGNETARSQRDWQAHAAIIDGENARRGVTGANNATLDGFTITRGFKGYLGTIEESVGGGMYIGDSPRIENCTFVGNSTSWNGGAIYNDGAGAKPTIVRCTFVNNGAPRGAAIFNEGAAPTIEQCVFKDNNAAYSGAGGYGGGIANYSSATPTVTNCVFVGGFATFSGGGIYSNASSPTVMNCSFAQNDSGSGGDPDGSGGNSGHGEGGGGIANHLSTAIVTNCALWDNSNGDIAGAATVTYSVTGTGYLGTGNITADPQFVDADAGDLRLKPASGCIDSGTWQGAPSADFDDTARPEGIGFDIGAYEYVASQDADGDGLPDAEEADQGLDEGAADAALYATIDYPSEGASFRTLNLPITLSGTLSSAYIDAVVVSVDGGATFPYVATLPGDNTWFYAWSPSTSGTYHVVAKASNVFGGFTITASRTVQYLPNSPVAVITAPIQGEHVSGTIDITGTAQAGLAGFGDYVLDYGAGTTSSGVTTWLPLVTSGTPVTNGVLLDDLNTITIADGPYVIRLSVTDGAQFQTMVTHVSIIVDNGSIAPSAASQLAIEGGLVANAVANGNTVNVIGTAEPGTFIESALVVDGGAKSVLEDVTSDITIHLNGSIRGTFTLPGSLAASEVALQLTLRNAAGLPSPPMTSNFLPVDNSGPDVTIAFPLQDAVLPQNLIIVSGVAEDVGAAGLEKMEFSTDGTNWFDAAGTSAWSYNWTPTASQPYTVRVRGTDKLGNSFVVTLDVIVDSTYPSAYILDPTQGQEINEGTIVAVTGTASDTTDFFRYKLQRAPGVSPVTGWQDITGFVTTPVTNGTLGSWNTTGLDEGLYTLRLLVSDTSFNFVIFDMQVVIRSRLSLIGFPNATLNEDSSIDDFVHLPDYASALSGDVETMTYSIIGNTNPNCGVSIDENNNIDIEPVENWNGVSQVTVQIDNGTLQNDDVFQVTVTAVNDAPTTPIIQIIPASPADADDLTCQVTTPSTDIEGTTVQYVYDWFTSSDGVSYGAPIRTMATTSASDTLPAASTINGRYYKCRVTPNDGNLNGPSVDATVRVLNDSTISASLNKSSIILGQSVTISGQIAPPEAVTGNTIVAFESTSPSGAVSEEFPEAISVSTQNYSRLFYPTEASEGRPDWTFEASWDGNATYHGATSSTVSLVVQKSNPTLEVDASASAVPLGYEELDITCILSATLPPDSDLLTGQTVTLYARRPDETFVWSPGNGPTAITDETGTAVFTAEDLDTAGLTLDMPGTWQFRADFAGDNNFEAAASPGYDLSTSTRVTVRDRAGYAVLAVGRLESGEGMDEHNKTADFVYRALVDRGLADQDIFYLRQGAVPNTPEFEDILVDDDTPTEADIQRAIEEEFADDIVNAPAPLYVIFIDHGSPGQFWVDIGANDTTDYITPEELNSFFEVLEAALGAKVDEPETDRVFIYGACRSGSFLPLMSAEGRLVITSCAAAEISHRGVIDPADNVRDGELFITEFFRNLRDGRDLKDSFERATNVTTQYTQGPANGAGEPAQTPLLDDNGDTVGTSGQLSMALGEDGGRAHQMELGYGVSNSGYVYATWTTVSTTITLGDGETMPALEALADKQGAGLETWIEVKTPTYQGDELADPGFEDSQEVVNLSQWTIPADPDDLDKTSDDESGTYRWSLSTPEEQAIFATPGTYAIYYYLRDPGDAENAPQVSPYALTVVYRESGENDPPDPVTLSFPANAAEVQTTSFFSWQAATDPEGDPVTYRLEVAEDDQFTTGPIVREGITDILTQLTEADGLQDLHQYYWRVIPVDQYGASPPIENNTVRSFTTNNNNPDLPAGLSGRVKDADTGQPIVGAAVSLTGQSPTQTNFTGQYQYPQLAAASYTVQASHANYESASTLVTLFAGNQRSIDFSLVPKKGSLKVTISPAGAIAEGAQWRVDGGLWHDSNFIVTGLTIGQHTVSFSPAGDWIVPANQLVNITHNGTATPVGAYLRVPGSLQVTIEPEAARNAGAKWRVNGGSWMNSGAVVGNLQPGSHFVDFLPVANWDKPADQFPVIESDETTQTQATYQPAAPPSLKVKRPNTNLQWKIGTKQKIKWESTGAVGPSVKIELWRNNQRVKVIKGSTPNDGKQGWKINASKFTAASGYFIKILSTSNTTIFDFSNKSFTLTPAKSIDDMVNQGAADTPPESGTVMEEIR